MLFVDKNDGKLRMCIDYKALNKVTIRNNYLQRHIDDLCDWLAKTKYFSHIDLKLGYYQIQVTDEDVDKLTYHTKYVFYEFFVMLFGMYNVC